MNSGQKFKVGRVLRRSRSLTAWGDRDQLAALLSELEKPVDLHGWRHFPLDCPGTGTCECSWLPSSR